MNPTILSLPLKVGGLPTYITGEGMSVSGSVNKCPDSAGGLSLSSEEGGDGGGEGHL